MTNEMTMTKKRDKEKSTTEQFEEALEKRRNAHYVLRLFVTGLTPRSIEAIENVRDLLEEHLKGRYELEVIDVYKEPDRACDEQVIAAPTLVKELPAPIRKLVGDMTKKDKLLAGLDIKIVQPEE